MLLKLNNAKLSGLYPIISNNTNGILFNNYTNHKNISINSNLNDTSDLQFKVFQNSQYLENNLKKQTFYDNSIYSFPSDSAGSGDYVITNLLDISTYLSRYSSNIYQAYNLSYKYSNNLIPIYNEEKKSGFYWTSLNSYSSIIASGYILNTSISSVLNFIQGNYYDLILNSENMNDIIIDINNINSFYGNIYINDINLNNIVYPIKLVNLNNINNMNIIINTTNINNLNNISGTFCNLILNTNINNLYSEIQNFVYNSNIYFTNNNTIQNLFNLKNLYNNNIFIQTNNISQYKIEQVYDEESYNKHNFINLNTKDIITYNNDIDYNNIFLSNLTLSYKNNNNYNINNNSKLTLDSHVHTSKINNTDDISNLTNENLSGIIFPIQTATQNLTHQITTNDNQENNILNKSVYLPLDKSINTTYIPQTSILPIGAIIGWAQVLIDENWQPCVPYGFYLLSTETYKVVVDGDNSKSIRYNMQLANLYSVSTEITLPTGKIIYYNNNNSRIVQILKYSDNWTYTTSRTDFDEKI